MYQCPQGVDARIKSGHDDYITIIASWPGPDPAIHVYRRPGFELRFAVISGIDPE